LFLLKFLLKVQIYSLMLLHNYNQGWQSHRRLFAIIVTQAKCDAIMIWTNGFDFFAIIKNFFMWYYRSSFSIIFCDFRFFR